MSRSNSPAGSSDSDSDDAPAVSVLSLYREVVAGIGVIVREETDVRRDIGIAFELERPARGERSPPAGADGAGPTTDSPYRADPKRAARRTVEDIEFDARCLVVHEEFGEHTALLRAEREASVAARYRSEASLRRSCDMLDRTATLGVLRLLAEAFVAAERLGAVENAARSRAECVSADRRSIEAAEEDGRGSISSFALTSLRTITRFGLLERKPLVPLQAEYAVRVTAEREARVQAALAMQRMAQDKDDREAVEVQEKKARRTLRQQEGAEFGDTQRSYANARIHLARFKRRSTKLTSSASFAGNGSFAGFGSFARLPTNESYA